VKTYDGPQRVGSIRPSQLVHTFGIGSLVDLPNLSVLVNGLDRWDRTYQRVVTEDRLLGNLQLLVGDQLEELRTPPSLPQTRNPFEEWARVGVPVTIFPRWLRCSRCNRLFPISSGALSLDANPYRPDRARYVHQHCDRAKRPPPALPARFVTGCTKGHLDEFPWIEYCHQGQAICHNPILRVIDIGTGGRATDLMVDCLTCGAKTSLGKAFGPQAASILPQCRGRHPHLGTTGEPCTEQLRTLLLGASNLWFSASVSVLSLPIEGGSLEQRVQDNWGELDEIDDLSVLAYALRKDKVLASAFAGFDTDEIWQAMEAKRGGSGPTAQADVLAPEWEALTAEKPSTEHFHTTLAPPPAAYTGKLAAITLAHRLRVVTALTGFTRINAPEPPEPGAPLHSTAPTWLPVVENRGEGIFVRLDEDAVQAWEARVAGGGQLTPARLATQEWRSTRGLDPSKGWMGDRFVLLHSLAHALINQLAIECGYSSASLTERIYSRSPGLGESPMAGILLYTSAPDAEGTLGGLVALGKPEVFGAILAQALERAGLCSSDPLCSDHAPSAEQDALHGAACHACLLVSETSCRAGNRFLDRAALVDTYAHHGIGFFS
jgi:hypothetical protein